MSTEDQDKKKVRNIRRSSSEETALTIIPKHIQDYVVNVLKEPDYFKHNELTPNELNKLDQLIKRSNLGIQAGVIQTCSRDCESHDSCPLAILKRAPYGNICPVEVDLYNRHFDEYKEAVKSRIKATRGDNDAEEIEHDRIMLTLIGELVEADILEMRANAMIATEGIVENVPVFATDAGPEFRLDEHTALRIKEKIKKRRDVNFRQLLATPEMVARSRISAKSETDSERISKTRQRAHELIRKKQQEAYGEEEVPTYTIMPDVEQK